MAGDDYLLSGLAVPDGLDDLHDLMELIGRRHADIPMADLSLFETAVIEIAGNVVEHGRPEGGVHWTFSLSVLPGRIEAVLSDDGHAFIPADAATLPMPAASAEDGRGLALAGRVLDALDYRRESGANHWRLVRTLG